MFSENIQKRWLVIETETEAAESFLGRSGITDEMLGCASDQTPSLDALESLSISL